MRRRRLLSASGWRFRPGAIRSALAEFRGVDRRFQLRGRAAGVSVVDDYGHHPTEIRATLAAARQCGYKRVHVIFQPHRYTRTQDLADEFATAFGDADTLFVLDIYAASEQPIAGVTGETLARTSQPREAGQRFTRRHSQTHRRRLRDARPGDLVLTLGAGNVSQLGPQIIERLEAKHGQAISAAKSTKRSSTENSHANLTSPSAMSAKNVIVIARRSLPTQRPDVPHKPDARG